MKISSVVVLVFCTIALGACSSTRIMSKGPTEISIMSTGNTDTGSVAQAHCASYEKFAKLSGIQKMGRTFPNIMNDSVHQYICVKG